MYGKFFASAFTGSMMGAGADVFAVWGYVIANTAGGQVEINPQLLAAMLGMKPDAVQVAVNFLCAPDPRSRSKVEDGRRLIREGEFAYRVPNFETYRRVRNEDDRRAYNRQKQAERRERLKQSNGVKRPVNDSQSKSALSAHAEAEAEAEVKAKVKAEKKEAPPRAGWVSEIVSAWPHGSLSHGKVGGLLKPLVEKEGAPEVQRRFGIFAASPSHKYGLNYFREHFADYVAAIRAELSPLAVDFDA